MKVVILHQHFNTPEKGGAIRSYYLAKALIDRGIQTVVITAHNNPLYVKTSFEGIEIHYLPVAYDNSFGFVARSVSFLRFVVQSVRLAIKLPDVSFCYAISAPLTVGLAAMRIKKRCNMPFMFEVGDLWPDAPIQMGFVRNYFFRWFLYGMEKRIYRDAESVVALSTAILSAIEKKVPGKEIHLIPNMADCEYYQPGQKSSVGEAQWQVKGKFVVSYIGAVGVANGLQYLLECAKASEQANLPVHFLICGDGASLNALKQSALRLNLQNLTFLGFQNRETVRQLMNVTDAVFVSYLNVPILETGSPNKFFDGLAAGKLIIVNFGGWIKEALQEHGCGIGLDPVDASEFPDKIRPFINDPNLLLKYQRASRKLGEEKYSRKRLSEEFALLFKGR